MKEGLNYLQTFNPVESSAVLLEKTLIGRKELVDLLEKLVIESAQSGNKHQRLIIGPRGSGKTHLLRVLYNRIAANTEINSRLKIAYLCEDEYGIATFLDLLIRIFRAFLKWDPISSGYLTEKLENLKKTPLNDQERIAKQILLSHIKNCTLLIMTENIGTIFNDLQDTGQQKLRDFLQQYPFITIVATNQALFRDIQDEDRPFHNFFKITHLKKISFEETIVLLKSIAAWEQREELLALFDKPEGRGRIKAIYDITGGNHRLLVTFYNFLKIDYKNKLSHSFIKTINDLIPYYQSFMSLLTPQQQKIIQVLCQNRNPVIVKEIAENCFSSPNTISKQMSNLVRLKYVEASSMGKETYYELAEPLLRICFEVKENRGGPIKLFIDFLGNLYSYEEIRIKHDLNKKSVSASTNTKFQTYKNGKKNMTDYTVYESTNAYYYQTKQFKQAIEWDTDNYWAHFNLTTCHIALDNISPALEALTAALATATRLDLHPETIQCFAENLTTLFTHSSTTNLPRFLREAAKLIASHNYTDEFLQALSPSIFNILVQYETISEDRYTIITRAIETTWPDNPSLIIPLKFLQVGIRHLKKKEKNVLFQFTKEERAVFKNFVLEKKKPRLPTT